MTVAEASMPLARCWPLVGKQRVRYLSCLEKDTEDRRGFMRSTECRARQGQRSCARARARASVRRFVTKCLNTLATSGGGGSDPRRSVASDSGAYCASRRSERREVLAWPSMFRALGLAALAVAACGGQVTLADDGGPPSGTSSQGSSGGAAGGSSSGGPSTGGSSGQTSPPSGGSTPGFVGADAGSAPSTIVDGAAPRTRDAAPGRCAMGGPGVGGGGGGGGSGGPGSCQVFAQETCAGISYQVTCTCPQATCACFGSSTSVVPFTGCPTCSPMSAMSAPALFALCGFPQ